MIALSKDTKKIMDTKADSFLDEITDLLSGVKWIIIGLVGYKLVTLAASFKNKPKEP
jgi:hypothetical protein